MRTACHAGSSSQHGSERLGNAPALGGVSNITCLG